MNRDAAVKGPKCPCFYFSKLPYTTLRDLLLVSTATRDSNKFYNSTHMARACTTLACDRSRNVFHEVST
jgi:hypothetical protein